MSRICLGQALPRHRLVRRRLVTADWVPVRATFSRPERGRTAKSLTEIHFVLVFPMFLKRRLVAAPLPLPKGAPKQPNGGTRAPVTNDLVLTGGLAIPDLGFGGVLQWKADHNTRVVGSYTIKTY